MCGIPFSWISVLFRGILAAKMWYLNFSGTRVGFPTRLKSREFFGIKMTSARNVGMEKFPGRVLDLGKVGSRKAGSDNRFGKSWVGKFRVEKSRAGNPNIAGKRGIPFHDSETLINKKQNLHKYLQIWTFKTMCVIAPLMILFPFIIGGYELFAIHCSLADIMTCVAFRISFYFKATVVNVVVNCLGILFITFSMYKSSKLKYHSLQARIERRLIYQAIFSSIFQLIYFLINGVSTYFSSDIRTLYLVGFGSQLIYHFHHYAVMITHFVFSPTFKTAFFNFYHLQFLIKSKTNVSRVIIIGQSPIQTTVSRLSTRIPTV